MSMKGKKIVLGITGSIAAYKAAILIRGLIKKGAEVQVVITPAGKEVNLLSASFLLNVTEHGTVTLIWDYGRMP